MRVTKKNQQQNGHREIVDAVKALCSEKDIEPEVLFSAIEEAMKAAYKKNVSRDEDAPSNLSVTMDRNTGDVHVFARKTITDDVEDPANQITLEDALTAASLSELTAIRSNLQSRYPRDAFSFYVACFVALKRLWLL